MATNDEAQKKLNAKWRKKDKATNVLSFPYVEPFSQLFGLIGDISLARETLQLEADEAGIDFEHHFVHLLIHGFLHNIGYDHINEQDGLEMEAMEVKILARLGIQNPYAELTENQTCNLQD